MPIEIRELTIKTDISVNNRSRSAEMKEKELRLLKQQLLEECKRMIVTSTQKKNHKR